ncbi:MAG: hypothetical protein ACYCV6_15750, partial [Steroidobacteraceae bacterium]
MRIVPELVAELKAYREAGSGEGLLFRTGKDNAMNPSNVHRDIWRPLLKRVGVPARDIYSARHTYASLARTAGESAFNVGQSMGHARSKLVLESCPDTSSCRSRQHLPCLGPCGPCGLRGPLSRFAVHRGAA